MPESRGERGARGAVVQGGRSHAVLAAAAVPSRQAGVVSSRLPQGAAGGGLKGGRNGDPRGARSERGAHRGQGEGGVGQYSFCDWGGGGGYTGATSRGGYRRYRVLTK